ACTATTSVRKRVHGVTVWPGAHTCTGTTRLLVVPSPSEPRLLVPQVQTVPSVFSATLKSRPAETALTFDRKRSHGATSPASQTRTGEGRSTRRPSPIAPDRIGRNWEPPLLDPHATTVRSGMSPRP